MTTEWNFDYTGTEQPITLKPGRYKLECWGASGGETHSATSHSGGGYSVGELILRKETLLYVYVGQLGLDTSSTDYAFNGGGYGVSTGGGATDIRLVGGVWDSEQGLFSRIIVAGGGSGGHAGFGGGNGGGLKGENSITSDGSAVGATQYDGGRGLENDGKNDGFFGKGGCSSNHAGGGGGWFGGSGCYYSRCNGGGGSGYVLTKNSYKPTGYTPTSEYWLENASTTAGKTSAGNSGVNGKAKITLLQTLPFLTVSAYNSTTATFKADHTDPALLTKIEYFIDDVLKETITTDLTTEKTINYTLEDNALHTLKIVVTDSANATVEKVLSISKNIMPLPEENVNLNDISTKLVEVNAVFKTGKTSIINTLALKNIEANLNNTLVELSEKIKTSFDSSDASVEELQNIITQKNNTISQLNTQLGQRKRWAKGIFDQTKITNDRTTIPMNLSFTPTIIFVTCGIEFNFDYASALRCNLKFFTNLVKTNPTALKGNDENFSGIVLASIEGISRSSFVLFLKNLKSNGSTAEISAISGTTFNWTAIE
ncbi:glycine-rich protein [Clostridioides difficile]|nr:glycine-rich protein [Clostridioides difficile]